MIRDKIKAEMAKLSPVSSAETDYAAKGYHLDVQVAPDQVVAAAEILDREGFFLEAVTGVDWLPTAAPPKPKPQASSETGEKAEGATEPAAPAEPPPPEMEVVYDFNTMRELCRVVVRTRLPRAVPELPSISTVFPGANWHERETHDFFGIRFVGHPNLIPLLLPEDADFHPLLKG